MKMTKAEIKDELEAIKLYRGGRPTLSADSSTDEQLVVFINQMVDEYDIGFVIPAPEGGELLSLDHFSRKGLIFILKNVLLESQCDFYAMQGGWADNVELNESLPTVDAWIDEYEIELLSGVHLETI